MLAFCIKNASMDRSLVTAPRPESAPTRSIVPPKPLPKARPMTRETVAELLRGRILRGLYSGAVAPGDRLPSAREAGAELGAGHRLVLAAYHDLAAEGLVELRERTGVYVARAGNVLSPLPNAEWLIDTLVEGLARNIPTLALPDRLRAAIGTRRLRAIVVEGTRDQIAGMSRELRDDYGLDVTGLDAADLAEPTPAQIAELDTVDLLVTTPTHARLVRKLGRRLGVPAIIARAGPDLVGGDWGILLREPLYLLVSDERSVDGIQRAFEDVPTAADNLHVLVVHRDDIASIPDDAAVYVTRGAAAALGSTPVPGRQVPTARGFSIETARQLVTYIVHANVRSLSKPTPAPPRR